MRSHCPSTEPARLHGQDTQQNVLQGAVRASVCTHLTAGPDSKEAAQRPLCHTKGCNQCVTSSSDGQQGALHQPPSKLKTVGVRA